MRILAASLFVFAFVSAAAFAQPVVDAAAYQYDPAAHRLFFTPTANIPQGKTVHANVGAMLFSDDEEDGVFLPLLRANVFVLNRFNLEIASYDITTERDGLPLTFGLCGQLYSSPSWNLGLGYHYFDHRNRDIHWYYLISTWNVGNNAYNVSAGLSTRPNRASSLSIAAGTVLSLGGGFNTIIDLAYIAEDPLGYGWLLFGVRYSSEDIAVEASTFLLRISTISLSYTL